MNNLHIISPIQDNFETNYIKVRDLEDRVYSDPEVASLPYLRKPSIEWKLREKSTNRFYQYLAKNHSKSSLLEIGCGNGWFTNLCSKQVQTACGVDLNNTELEQAARVFQRKNLNFYYWDTFTESPFTNNFDIIVLNGVIQYFPDFELILSRLRDLLKPHGEIHIIDSPFYRSQDILSAQKRTKDNYTTIGVPEMSEFYFHHNVNSIKDFKVLYKPSRIRRLLTGKDSPFGWYKYDK